MSDINNAGSDLIFELEDRPPFHQALVGAITHLLAIFVPMVTPALIVGAALQLSAETTAYLVSMAMIASGIGTWLQVNRYGIVGSGLLSIQSVNFSFVTVMIALGSSMKSDGFHEELIMSSLLGVSFVGAFLVVGSSFILPYLRRVITPTVSGIVVLMIGLSLIPVAVDWFAGGQRGDANYATPENLMMASFVLVIVVALVQWGKGIFSAAAIVIGMMTGYIVCLAMGWVSFEGVKQAQTFAIPQPLHFGLAFPISGIIGMSIAYLVTIVESSGNFLALGNATKTEITGRHLRGGVLADGLGSALAAIMSTTPFSSFSQNIGVISLTGVASRHVVALTGVLLALAGLFPVFGALIVSIPLPVLGGAGLMMFAMIIAAGIQMLDKVARSKRNGLIIAISIGCGLAVTTRPELLDKLPHFFKEVLGSGITVGSLLALILNLVLPEDKVEETKE